MNKWLKAELDYWKSQKSQAIATLELYFNKSVGIGEHSDLSSEIHKWISKLSEATENLSNLKLSSTLPSGNTQICIFNEVLQNFF